LPGVFNFLQEVLTDFEPDQFSRRILELVPTKPSRSGLSARPCNQFAWNGDAIGDNDMIAYVFRTFPQFPKDDAGCVIR
jgi:hypothetical protein